MIHPAMHFPSHTAITHGHNTPITDVILYPLKGVIIVLCIEDGLGFCLRKPATSNNATPTA